MKDKMFKRIVAGALALLMVGSSLPSDSSFSGLFGSSLISSSAAQAEVSYTKYSWNESTKELSPDTVTTTDYTVVTSSLVKDSSGGTGKGLTSGTYVVKSNTTVEDYIYIRKGTTVNLVVQDGVTLTCKKGIGCGYDKDNSAATLNIYGGGTIVTTGESKAAGIGGKNDETNGWINIHGTTIEATGGNHAAGIGGGEGGKDPDAKSPTIKIYNGTITATGGVDGAGIGGGDEQPGARTYIYSGTVTASSSKHGAGIGGGDEEGTYGVHIYGGKVTATGGEHGAGIGAGEGGGNLRKASDGGGVNIYGGEVIATGGKNAAGIGGGYNEDMSGDINISGEDTKVTADGIDGAAGIGAGRAERGVIVTDKGDMGGTITIDCGLESRIIVHGGDNHKDDESYNSRGGAGIGAGFGGNLYGKVYINGGKLFITSGYNGAGIGGGAEDGASGGEGGDVYVGGGNIEIHLLYDHLDGKSSHAIGAGHADSKSGSVYISEDVNKTGKHMRVCYKPLDETVYKTASKDERSNKCHTKSDVIISECEHTDYDASSGLSYKEVTNTHHTEFCKYCGYSETTAHSASPCECGYDNQTRTVTLHMGGGTGYAVVALNSELVLPYSPGELVGGNTTPRIYSRVLGWTRRGDEPEIVYQPGSSITVTDNMEFDLVTEKTYLVEFDDVQNGDIDADVTDATAGETVTIDFEPDVGYTLSKASYKYYTSIKDNEPVYCDPIEIVPVDNEYKLVMPELADIANGIVVSAEFKKDTKQKILISEDITNGTVSADFSEAEPSTPITITAEPADGYYLERIRCRTSSDRDVELSKLDDTHYTFEMPDESVVIYADFEVFTPNTLYSANMTLGSELGLNFYLDVPESVVTAGTKVVMNGPNDETEVLLSDADTEGSLYKATYRVNAIQADREITLKLVGADGNTLELYNSKGELIEGGIKKYSVNKYLAAAHDYSGVTDMDREKIRATYTYCAYSAKWKYGTAVPENDYVNELPDLTVSDLSKFKITEENPGEQIKIIGCQLVLDSSTTLRLNFTCSDSIDNHTAHLGDTSLTIVPDGKQNGLNKYYVKIPNINAGSLEQNFEIVFDKTETSGHKVTLCAMSYVYYVLLNKDNPDCAQICTPEVVDVVRAIYAYGEMFK